MCPAWAKHTEPWQAGASSPHLPLWEGSCVGQVPKDPMGVAAGRHSTFSLPEPGNLAGLGVSTPAGVEASSAPAPALALPDRSKLQGHWVRCG